MNRQVEGCFDRKQLALGDYLGNGLLGIAAVKFDSGDEYIQVITATGEP